MAEKAQKKENRLVAGAVTLINKYLPDAFIFAIVLTLVVFVAAVILNCVRPLEGSNINFFMRVINVIKNGWYGGFWSLLAFSMQMAMVIVTGSILSDTPAVKKLLVKLASLPKTPQTAVWLVAFFSLVTGWLNWGVSIVISGILAKEIAKQVKGVHYALMIAGGYFGLAIWHGGFSGSIPLQVASESFKFVGVGGNVIWQCPKGGLAFNQTIFAPSSLIANALCMIIMPLIAMKMHPSPENTVTVNPAVFAEEVEEHDDYDKKTATPAVKMEHSMFLNYFIVVLGVIAMIMYFVIMAQKHQPFSMDLNFVNFLFLILSMALFKRPIYTVRSVSKFASGAAGVMLQFPFYGGISGMMTYQGGATISLAKVLSNIFVSISTSFSFPLWIFLSAGIVNFFVPSGGGQWQVQGPIVMQAALDPKFTTPSFLGHGVGEGKAAMCVAWGDCWTNMIQPFWALPLLAVAKLQARDIMGYCTLMLFVEFVIVALCLLFLP